MEPLIFVLIYLTIGFLALYITWLITAIKYKKTLLLLKLRSTVLIQSSLNLLHLISGLFFPMEIGPDVIVRSFGLTLFTVGVWFAIWARLSMGKYWNVPGALFANPNDTCLVRCGPFGYSRNPIYVGIILISFGMAIALRSVFFIFSFFLYIHLYLQIREEEKSMSSYFHDEYTKYRIEVPRFI